MSCLCWEELNLSLQQRSQTTSGMQAAVEHLTRGIQDKRSEGASKLKMFQANYKYATSSELADILREMVPEVRHLFKQVEVLLRLLMVVPASSAEAERSFSGLRRLKTWLRTSMTQTRLNNLAICHVHQEKLDALDRRHICQRLWQAVLTFIHLQDMHS
ncbi:hypothetical protein QQF64_024014 [Cirrhinus molitorella]|uniref:HAT C-terminal dimerisation domain-containing protein n=1 Tax=Cirrhinus molitorella TaxID=172907 RepID=A0ABR3NKX9_9TELE